MFDLNAIVSAALNAAVNARITEVLAQHANIVGGLAERIAALETNETYLTNRIAALENNPAQGVDTQATPTTDITQHIINALSDTDHPLFKRLSSFMDAVAEQAIDDHCSNYDHDDYDSAVSKVDDLPDFDDYVTRDSVREEIEDVINNATLSIRA